MTSRSSKADDQERRHLALVEAFPHERYLRLSVRGPSPQSFFALLKDGIELTLARYPGLKIQRKMPCPGHGSGPCTHEFDYEHLQKRLELKPPRVQMECPVAVEDVDVRSMLFGLTPSRQDDVLKALDDLRQESAAHGVQLRALTELTQREFTRAFHREQHLTESHCPNVFVLRPVGSREWRQRLAGTAWELQLLCQAPAEWHYALHGGKYTIKVTPEWLQAIQPYVRRLVSVLKYVVPVVGPVIGVAAADYEAAFKVDLKLMEELVKKLPEVGRTEEALIAESESPRGPSLERAEGAALRALRSLLDEVDEKQLWGGLRKVLTPEGHYLWLCEHHAAPYLA